MAHVYHRDQPGSPALTYTTSSTAISHWQGMVAVLKACLVTGFGSQPAAGWELIFEDANTLVLRNGSHTGYICLSVVAAGVLTVSLAETFAGVSDGIIVGDGAKTGIATGNTVPHRQSYRSFAYNVYTSWWVIADDKTFVFGRNGVASGSIIELTGTVSAGYELTTLYVGEDSLGNFIACGGLNVANTSTPNCMWGSGFTALRDPNTGLLVDTSSLDIVLPGAYWANTRGWFTASALPEAAFCKHYWGVGTTFAKFRGIAMSPYTTFMYMSEAAQMFGHSGPLTQNNAHLPLVFEDGHSYLVCPKYREYAALIWATNNPEYW